MDKNRIFKLTTMKKILLFTFILSVFLATAQGRVKTTTIKEVAEDATADSLLVWPNGSTPLKYLKYSTLLSRIESDLPTIPTNNNQLPNGAGYLTEVTLSDLAATGTPSMNTILRGDNTWVDFGSEMRRFDSVGSGLDADLLDGISSASFLRSDANTNKTSGFLAINDAATFLLGTGGDMKLYHDGTNNLFDLVNGNLIIRDNTTTRFTFNKTTGSLTATNFNGVALTTGGSATNFLNEQGNYVSVTGGGVDESANYNWLGTHTYDSEATFNGGIDLNGTNIAGIPVSSYSGSWDGSDIAVSRNNVYDAIVGLNLSQYLTTVNAAATYQTIAGMDTFAELDAIVSDKSLVNKNDANTWASTQTFTNELNVQGGIDVNGTVISNVADATLDGQAVNKGQLDAAIGVSQKTITANYDLLPADDLIYVNNSSAITIDIDTDANASFVDEKLYTFVFEQPENQVTFDFLTGVTGTDFVTYSNTQTVTIQRTGTDTWKVLNPPQPLATTFTGTVIPLDKYYQHDDTATDTATWTIGKSENGGFAEILVNLSTEPTITGATQISNTASFIADTLMVLTIKNILGTEYYYFTEL